MSAKKKEIDGVKYLVTGSTIERKGIHIVRQVWSTTKGKVIFDNGKFTHPEVKVGE